MLEERTCTSVWMVFYVSINTNSMTSHIVLQSLFPSRWLVLISWSRAQAIVMWGSDLINAKYSLFHLSSQTSLTFFLNENHVLVFGHCLLVYLLNIRLVTDLSLRNQVYKYILLTSDMHRYMDFPREGLGWKGKGTR